AAADRFLDQGGIDIDDAVGEAFLRPGAAIVKLVRVQDVALARQAVPALSPEVEALNAGQRDADRIGVVPVQGEGRPLPPKSGLQALDPGRTGPEPDAVLLGDHFPGSRIR